MAKKKEFQLGRTMNAIDCALTYEELFAMFESRGIDLESLEEAPLDEASPFGRNFARSGGVAQAVVNAIKQMDPDREIKVASAQGLADCKRLLMMARAGKYNGYLLEGMACPGGCVAGAGTITPVLNASSNVRAYKAKAEKQNSLESGFVDRLKEVEQ